MSTNSGSSRETPSIDANGENSSINILIDRKESAIFVESSTGVDGSTLSFVSAPSNYYNGRRRRPYSHRKPASDVSVKADENITKESLLWFQSLKKHWLNSPRTPIQPILPIPTLFDTEPKDPIVATTTSIIKASNNQSDDSNSNIIVVEKSSVKNEEAEWANTDTISLEEIKMNTTGGNTNINCTESSNIVISNTDPMQTNFRERLIQFYQQYNPSKLSNVDATLQKYSNREEELFQELHSRYCRYRPVPTNINHDRPIVFLEFEYFISSNDSSTAPINQGRNNQQQKRGGTVQIQLFHDITPFTAENFRCLCTGEKGSISNNNDNKLCYINTFMHRIVPNMCIQGGDITTGDGTGGRSIYTTASRSNPKTDLWGNFVDETFMVHSEPGLLSMANNGPDRNNSQFFITLRPLPHLNGKHVVFGKVTSGMDIVHDIARHAITDPNPKIIDCGEIQQDADDAIWICASSEHRLGKNVSHNTTKADFGSADPNDLSDQVTGSDALPNHNASSHAQTRMIIVDNCTSELVANDNINDSFNSIEVIASNDSVTTVIVPNVDGTSLHILPNEKSGAIKNSHMEDTVMSIEAATTMNTTASGKCNSTKTNSATSDCVDTSTILSDDPCDNDTNKAMSTKLFPAWNVNHPINCHTQPTCRTLFENLLEREAMSVISSSTDASSDADIVGRESNAPNTIKSNLYRPTDKTSDKNVAATSASTTALFQQSSTNDESTTTAIDTSFGGDASNCSVLTTASSASEQVEWLHRLIDEAQIKLRLTRKKLEDRIKVLNCQPTSTGLGCDKDTIRSSSICSRHVPTPSQPQTTSTVPSEVSLNLNTNQAHVALTRALNDDVSAEEVPINYQCIASFLNVKKSHDDHDGRVNVTMPSIPPDVGIPLLLRK